MNTTVQLNATVHYERYSHLKSTFIKDKVFEAKGFCSYFTVFNCNLTFNYYNFSDLIKST